DGGDDARWQAELLERILQRKSVDDGGEHAHVVGRRPIHSARAGGEPPKNIAASDDDGRFYAERVGVGDVLGNLRRHRGIDAELLLAHQRFAGKLEKYSPVERGRIGGHEPELYVVRIVRTVRLVLRRS